MKLNEKSIRWLEAELIVILAVVLLLGVLFGYSLAASRMVTIGIDKSIIEQPTPDNFGVGSEGEGGLLK